ncbi:MAG: family 78 glycoside hydrolase catalytic domain [Terriglobia bacterium]
MTRRDFVKLGTTLAGASGLVGAARDSKAAAQNAPHTRNGAGWTAKPVWATSTGLEPNTYVYFRRAFILEEPPQEQAVLRISASTQYILYVNGQKIGFGPPISDPRRCYFDVRSILPYLRKGPNVVAALVYSLATATEDTTKERGWLILQGGVHDGGREVVLDTGSEWKCLLSEVWRRDAPRQSMQLHYVEIADLRRELPGWNEAGFDDSQWQSPIPLSELDLGNLFQRELGEIEETYVPVASVVRAAEVLRHGPFTVPALEVSDEKFHLLQTVRLRNLRSVDAGHPAIEVETPVEGRDAALVFDMGRMVLGCPVFAIEGGEGTVIDVSISEYLKDGRVLASRAITSTERTNLTDRITLRSGRSAWQRSDYNGFRYVQLTVRGAKKPLTIRKIGTVERRYLFQHEAQFRSSNSTLDRIFSGSKWSHRVNSHWGYCGSAWREHAQWSDLPWPAMNVAVFHDPPMMRYYLRQIVLGQNGEGRMQFPHPGGQGGELPEQTMWLANDLWKCGLYFRDFELVRDLLPAWVKANEWFKRHLTGRGLMTTENWPKMWLVIDWGYPYVNNPAPGELATLNVIYYNFLRCVERCAELVKEAGIQNAFKAQADFLQQTIQKVFFAADENRYYEKPERQSPSQFASTLAVKYSLVPSNHLRQVFEFAVGEELRPGKASPWFMYSVLETFAKAGRYTDAISSICRYWSSFLEAGATTYWELWNIPGENVAPLPGYTAEMAARTITYSSGPAAYIINHVLGVQPLTPGFERTLVAPHYSGLDYAEGSAPTPKGDIHVRWQRGGTTKATEVYVTIPSGIQALMRLPFERAEPFVSRNGQLFYDGRQFLRNSRIENPTSAEDFLQFQVKPGSYYFKSGSTRERSEF